MKRFGAVAMLLLSAGCTSDHLFSFEAAVPAVMVRPGFDRVQVDFVADPGISNYVVSVGVETAAATCAGLFCSAEVTGLDNATLYTVVVTDATPEANVLSRPVVDVALTPPGLRVSAAHRERIEVPSAQRVQGMHFGASVAVGDLNGDGQPTLVIAALGGDATSSTCGAVDANVSSSVFLFDGTQPLGSQAYGPPFVGAGLGVVDLNADGINELVIGDPSGDGLLEAHSGSGFDPSPVVLDGATASSLGGSLVVAGDRVVSGAATFDPGATADRGRVDIVVGSPGGPLNLLTRRQVLEPTSAPEATTVGYGFGSAAAAGTTLLVGAPAGPGVLGGVHFFEEQAGDFVEDLSDVSLPLRGSQDGARFGHAVAIANGVPIVAEPGWDVVMGVETDEGRLFAFPDLASPTVFGGAPNPGGQLGHALAAIDLNGDGTHEVIASAPFETGGLSRVTIWYDGDPASPEELAAEQGTGLGFVIADAGDLNGDGSREMLIGAPCAISTSTEVGWVYLQYGAPGSGPPVTVVPIGALEQDVVVPVNIPVSIPGAATLCGVKWGDDVEVLPTSCAQGDTLTHTYERPGVYFVELTVEFEDYPSGPRTRAQFPICVGADHQFCGGP